MRVRRPSVFASRTFVGSGPSVASSSSSSAPAEACPMLFHWARPPSWESIARRNNNRSLLMLQTLVPQSLLVPLLGQSTSTFRLTRSKMFPEAFVLVLAKPILVCGVQGSVFRRGRDAILLFRNNVFYFSNDLREPLWLERGVLI